MFVGDAGNTEASRPSRRIGAEFTLDTRLTLDLDAAYTNARFREDDPSAPGRHIPGATEGVVSADVLLDFLVLGLDQILHNNSQSQGLSATTLFALTSRIVAVVRFRPISCKPLTLI